MDADPKSNHWLNGLVTPSNDSLWSGLANVKGMDPAWIIKKLSSASSGVEHNYYGLLAIWLKNNPHVTSNCHVTAQTRVFHFVSCIFHHHPYPYIHPWWYIFNPLYHTTVHSKFGNGYTHSKSCLVAMAKFPTVFLNKTFSLYRA